MRPRISIRGSVRPSVRRSVGPSVGPSVRRSVGNQLFSNSENEVLSWNKGRKDASISWPKLVFSPIVEFARRNQSILILLLSSHLSFQFIHLTYISIFPSKGNNDNNVQYSVKNFWPSCSIDNRRKTTASAFGGWKICVEWPEVTKKNLKMTKITNQHILEST